MFIFIPAVEQVSGQSIVTAVERYCGSQTPGICGMKYHLDEVGGSVLSVSAAQPPSTFWTVAVNVSVLGNVQVVNFQEEPGTNPSGSTGGRSLTT